MFGALRSLARASLLARPPAASTSAILLARGFHASAPALVTMNQAMRRKKPVGKKNRSKAPRSPLLDGNPFHKGVISLVTWMKPKKPNSAKRKVARIKLVTGKAITASIRGEGHNLQEHNVVLVRGGVRRIFPVSSTKLFVGSVI